MFDIKDLRPTIVPKSDQLNADQLLSGPITVAVTGVTVSDSAEQPVTVHYEGENGRPFKPCKTMRKVLVFAWGHDGSAWAGQSMTIYNDPSVQFGGVKVGGIRISHITGIKGDVSVSLTATKGKKATHTIKTLKPSRAAANAKHISDMAQADATAAALEISGWEQGEIDAAWQLLSDDTIKALEAAWPQGQPA